MERQPRMYNTGADYALAIIGGKAVNGSLLFFIS